MEITSPGQLTGSVIRGMREAVGKTQQEFWGPLGVSKGRASTYEREQHPISQTTQLLVYLHHVCGFPVSLEHEAMVAAGAVAGSAAKGIASIKRAAAIAEGGADTLRSALACLGK